MTRTSSSLSPRGGARVSFEPSVIARQGLAVGARVHNTWRAEHWRRRKSGALYLLEAWEWANLITNAGLDYLHDVAYLSATQITAWYILLLDGTPTVAAGDTMASHAGWAEITNYDEATREAWTGVGTGVGTGDNSAALAEFTISTGGATVGGAGLTSVATKGDATGTFLAGAAFGGGNRALVATDVLRIRANTSIANA